MIFKKIPKNNTFQIYQMVQEYLDFFKSRMNCTKRAVSYQMLSLILYILSIDILYFVFKN